MLETVLTFLGALFFATGALMWSMWTAKFISRDGDGIRHSAKMVWRALALLQLEIEEDGEGP